MITVAAKEGTIVIEFWNALLEPDNQFLRFAVCLGLLAGLPFGIIGSYVVTRRISYLAGAISHCAFGGIGAGLYLRAKFDLEWLDPIYCALVWSILAAIIIGAVSLYAQQREDTVIGAIWAGGMAAGLLFLDKTPGYFNITSYLFGDMLLTSESDLWMVAGLDIVVVVFSIYFYNTLLAVCFDYEFARLRGIRAGFFYIALLCLASIAIVLLVRTVGIILVIALLTIPAAIAAQFSRRLWQMMALAVFLCMLFNISGLALSYIGKTSSGPTIIAVSIISYLAVLAAKTLRQKFKKRRS